MAEVKMKGFWTDYDGKGHDASPGDVIDLPENIAREAVANGTAVYATKSAAKE